MFVAADEEAASRKPMWIASTEDMANALTHCSLENLSQLEATAASEAALRHKYQVVFERVCGSTKNHSLPSTHPMLQRCQGTTLCHKLKRAPPDTMTFAH
jgi:hypothetical protein